MKYLSAMVIVLLLSEGSVFAETSYIRSGSIGKQQKEAAHLKQDGTKFRPIENLLGEQVIFLPKMKSSLKHETCNFVPVDRSKPIPFYENRVGRIGKITKIQNNYSERMFIQMEDTGEVYVGSGLDHVDDIGILADIENARSRHLGNTLWSVQNVVATYDENTDEVHTIKIKKYSPLKVLDIVAGWDNDRPVRFIVRTPAGEEGFVDVNWSGTNVSHQLKDSFRFKDFFVAENPKKKFKWSQKVWSAIEKDHVFVGMNAAQVRLSWGDPDDINKTYIGGRVQEQWVYGSGSYVYLQNGVVTAIQN